VTTFRVTLAVALADGQDLTLPLAPVFTRREDGGAWCMDFLVEGDSFDQAAGRLWGEAVACGLDVRIVEPTRSHA
jgi:hypothetical protein